VLEKVKVDETFRGLSEQIPAQAIYEMIDILNKSHQEMKWTNHPRIFFEVAVVKICQTSHQSAADLPEVDMLMKKIQQLEQEVERLKTTGIKAAAESPKKETPRVPKG
ncbi:DNA polymerase III subunit gamma/tau, partial [Bacillus spizizenii]|nr:DNA polymerase III subunit gamma/tau [Bacillus spizizenii]